MCHGSDFILSLYLVVTAKLQCEQTDENWVLAECGMV
jgi:hypothetical protein